MDKYATYNALVKTDESDSEYLDEGQRQLTRFISRSRTDVHQQWAGGGASQQLDPFVHDNSQVDRAILRSLDTKKEEDKLWIKTAWGKWIVFMHNKRKSEIREYRQALEAEREEIRRVHSALAASRDETRQAHIALEASREETRQAHASLDIMKNTATHCVIFQNSNGSLPLEAIPVRNGFIEGIPITTPSGSGFIIPTPCPNGLTLMFMHR